MTLYSAWLLLPSMPLIPGATYEVTGSLENANGPSHCAPELVPIEFEFQADLGPAAPLVPPTVSAVESVALHPSTRLDDLACCDGAMPSQHTSDCGTPAGVDWDEGSCTAIRGTGSLSVELTLEHGLPPATAMMVSRRIIRNNQQRPAGFDDVLEVTD